jgi:putative OPT family oligopeptide transporter
MSPVIGQAIGKVVAEVSRLRRRDAGGASVPRTEQDIPIGRVVAATVLLAALMGVYFRFVVLAGTESATATSLAALGITLVISFLFAPVSAWAVALISTTPISGMTLTTLIISAVLLPRLGLKGPEGALSVLLIGGIVCTALSMTGSMVTMLKVGYWVGATPRRIQWALVGGSVLASATVTGVIMLFAHTYGYVADTAHASPVAAPQANAMAAVIQSVMQSGQAPWFLYGLGAVIAVIVMMLGISPLAFALGMYLPLELNTPILAGALFGWLVKRRSGDTALDRARGNRGTLIASGFIAGGAIAGVLDALAKWLDFAWLKGLARALDYGDTGKNWVGLGVFLLLGAFLYRDARRAKAEEGAGPEITM